MPSDENTSARIDHLPYPSAGALVLRRLLWALLACAAILIVIGLFQRAGESRPEALLDRIVTPKAVSIACEVATPFGWKTDVRGERATAIADFDLGSSSPEFFYRVEIALAPAGKFIQPLDYEQAIQTVRESDCDRPIDERLAPAMFPPIGLRATWICSLGPGGGDESIAFTTRDGAIDCRVTLSTRLDGSLPDPKFSCQRLATAISDRYDAVYGHE